MDCPSEERMIRMKLQEIKGIRHLEFDLKGRKLLVYHDSGTEPITQAIQSLNLGGKHVLTEETEETFESTASSNQARILKTVLFINFAFFLIEIITGWLAGSMGLIADSLDMLADSIVYGLSLLAIGGSMAAKKKVAKWAGYFQILLALTGFFEVIRRFIHPESLPDYRTMIIVSILALIANAICLYLLQKAENKEEAHIQASMIFTSNDVIINIGVILAALTVHFTHSALPDLIIGTLVFILVIRGAVRILKLSR